MATLIHDCPHCHSRQMAFAIVGIRGIPNSGESRGAGTASGRLATVGLQCQSCMKGAAATVRRVESVAVTHWQTHMNELLKEGPSVPGGQWAVQAFWPAPQPSRIPEHLPDVVARAFRQGETNLAVPDHEEAAATMFRRALDTALKLRFPDLKGDLHKKIGKLAETHVIPGDLAEWAHEVRGIGNDGAHDLEGCTQDDAEAARDFVDAVLRYLFSLPGMIAARRPEPDEIRDGAAGVTAPVND